MKTYLFPFFLLFLFASCSDNNNNLKEKLKEAVTEGEAGAQGYKTVQMADLTDFEWETMYYFQPNDDKKSISDAIGFRWDGDPLEANVHRLMFVKGEEVVSYIDYNYSEFPLFVYGCEGDKWVYPKSRTEFATFEYCDGENKIYTFIPVQCVENIRELVERKCPEGTE